MCNIRLLLPFLVCLILIGYTKICGAESGKMGHTVIIFSGHVSEPSSKVDNMGAESYAGIFEYEFNDAVVRYFEDESNRVPGIHYEVVPASRNIGLHERVEYANRIVPDLYLEIHHDAAQAEDIERARQDGEGSPLWNDMSGFSVHYSESNPFSEKSKTFAQVFADKMLRAGFKPNLYHADTEKMTCIDRSKGIYNRINPGGLYVLYNIKSPAVVIECGTIINPHEEKLLSLEDTRQKIVHAINRAIVRFFEIEDEDSLRSYLKY